MLFISVYSRYVPLNYILFFSALSEVAHFSYVVCHRCIRKKVSKVLGVVNQVSNMGEVQFMPLKCRSTEDNFCAKNSINWANIDQVITLCANWGLKS